VAEAAVKIRAVQVACAAGVTLVLDDRGRVWVAYEEVESPLQWNLLELPEDPDPRTDRSGLCPPRGRRDDLR
jgi:hypothetical protein